MGWSCTAAADDTARKWSKACVAQSGSSNQWEDDRGTFFFELSTTEHDDGAITGTIWKFLPGGTHVNKAGSFRINGDGTIARAPKFLKEAAK